MSTRPSKSPSSGGVYRSDSFPQLEISIPSPTKPPVAAINEETFVIDDFFRCWYEQRDFGALATESPLQSALATLSFQNDEDKMAVIEDALISLANGTRNGSLKQIDFALPVSNGIEDDFVHFPDSIANNTISQILSEDKLKLSAIRDWPIQEVLEFGNDMLLISKNERARAEAETKAEAKAAFDRTWQEYEAKLSRAKDELDAVKRDLSATRASNNNNNNSSSNSTMQEVESKTKHKFSSGKDLYVADGGKFQPHTNPAMQQSAARGGGGRGAAAVNRAAAGGDDEGEPLPPELQHCDKNLVEKILSDIIHTGQAITFDDIAGLEFAKKCVLELICWPMSRPDLFQGLRALPRGVLLFGPPGTGKTLIGKAIAHQAGATFFSISASSMTSKWIGEGEKLVKTLFAVAAYKEPSVVFMDEVDSLLCQRSSEENEASRRLKTEFLVQLDGAGTNLKARVVIVGATNRPDELDEAARRRFVKRIYIPLPDNDGRRQLLYTLLSGSHHDLKDTDIELLVERTLGFSGADARALCTEAAMGPVREIALIQGDLAHIRAQDVPPITMIHFANAFDSVKPTVSPGDLLRYVDWNKEFGSFRRME